MVVSSGVARSRWADVLDAVNQDENVVVTRRGKPYAVVVKWRKINEAPPPFLLLSRLPESWRFFGDALRNTMTVLHPSGLWSEVAMEFVVGASELEADAIVDALERARRCGMVGRVMLSVEIRDGQPFAEAKPHRTP